MKLLDNFITKPIMNKAHYVMYRTADVLEKMKGQVLNVSQNNVSYTKELGEPHPYDYDITEGISNEFGLIDAFVDKLVNHVWGRGFSTKAQDVRDKEIIDNWTQEVGFGVVGRDWITSAVKKGTGYMELSGAINEIPTEIKVLNPKRMFIKRDETGSVIFYYQKRIVDGKISDEKPIIFKPYEIACLKIKPKNEDSAYGLGIIYPNLKTINYFLQNQKDLHDLIRRKANSPMVAKLGNKEKDEYPTGEEIQNFGNLMTYMQSKTEWAISANVDLSVLNFGDVGKNFDGVLRNDFELMMFGFQTPEALLGQGNIPEGLGSVQMDAYDRYSQAIQNTAERVIENQIFSRILQANGRKGKVEFIWGQQSSSETNTKISQLNTLLTNIYISDGLRKESEVEICKLLELDTNKLTTPKDSQTTTNKEPQPKFPAESYEGKTYIGRVTKDGKSKKAHSHN